MLKLFAIIGSLFGLVSTPVASVSPTATPQPRVIIQQKVDDLKNQLKVLEVELKLPGELKSGAEGDSVDQLQQSLVTLGIMKKEDVTGKRFGPKTENALKQFQAANSLDTNGRFDVPTKLTVAKALAALPGAFTPTITADIMSALDSIAGICPEIKVAVPSPSVSVFVAPGFSAAPGTPAPTAVVTPTVSTSATASKTPTPSGLPGVTVSSTPTVVPVATVAPAPTKAPAPTPAPRKEDDKKH